MDGVIIINKPKGYTSHDVVNVVRKKLNIKKVGHTGTLDPNATGVLPILIGQATKISKYLIEHNKEYIAELKLGEKSSTGDREGEIIQKAEIPKLTEQKVEEILKSFLGKQEQTPPIYSSIKINGKKGYEYARKGQKVEIPAREIKIIDISLIEIKNEIIKFKVKCSKGTYIRVLCEDIADRLGTIGYMKELERTSVNEFNVANSITLDKLDNIDIKEKVISIENIFKDKSDIELNNRKLELFLNGVKLTYDLEDELYRVYSNNNFIGLGIVKNKLLKRDIVVIDK